MKVGFVGVGQIGAVMAAHLLRAGHDLTVLDTRPEAMAPLVQQGARAGSTPAELSKSCEVVFGCLASLSAFREVVAGPQGLIGGDAMRVYVHVGTTGSALVQELATQLAASGADTIDAPMTGGTPRARAGTLTVMASGPRPAFDLVEALLATYSTKIVYLGDKPGIAQSLKLINNMVSAANLAIGAEAMVMGAKAGLDPELMLEVMNNGTAQNSALLSKIPDHVLTRRFDYGSGIYVTEKDLSAWRDEAEALQVPCWVGVAVRQLYMHAAAEGGSQSDMTSIVQHIERWAGTTVPQTRA